MTTTNDNSAGSSSRASEEYKSLRDETLKRVELRNQLWNFTLLTTGAVLTFGTSEHGTRIVFALYPVITLFFASAFSYNTCLLIEMGTYIREVSEKNMQGLGWATFLEPKYQRIEILEHVATYGLFVVMQLLVLWFGFSDESPLTTTDTKALTIGLIATFLSFVVILYPKILQWLGRLKM